MLGRHSIAQCSAPLALALAAALAGSGIAADAVLGAGSASSDTTHPPAGATNSDAKVVRELPKLRTATSDTYLLADGAREARAFAQPVNYRNAAGEWTPISDALQQANDGSFHPAASPVAVSLPSTLASGPVSVGSGESALSFALQDALPGQASSAGARRTYAGVMPGVSASLTAAPGALRELLRLESAAAPSTYTYALSYGPLLHASLTPQGALTFRNNAGKLIYTIPAPTLADSSAHGREAQSAPARYELSANGRTLTLLIDKAWLDSPARVFPVKVDPDVAFGEAAGCTIANESYAGTSLCASSEPLTVGVQGESPKIIRRSLIRFELSSIPRGSVIISSNLRLFFSEEQWEDIPIEVEAYGLTRSFTSGATWDSFNGSKPWSTPGGDYETTLAGHNTIYNSERGGWVTFGFTPLVERWVQQPGSNHGVLLKAHDESATGFDVFAQSDNGEELGEPYMQVIYSPRLGDQEAAMVTAGELAGGAEALVNVTNGNLFVESPDVEYSGEGYETDLTRFYNSQDEEVLATGAFGPGWRIGAGEDALLYSAWWDASQTFHEPGGAYARFDPSPPGSAEAHPWQLTYNPPPGLEASLSAHEDGTRTLTYEESGTEWLFDSSEYGFPTEIVEHEGAGNTISLSYTEGANRDLSSLSDSHGDSLTIKREAAGEEGDRIAKIEGTGGKTWTYAYNSYGQLSSYEGPAGEKTSYGYHEWLLHTIEDSSGTYVVSYDEADPRRVTSVRRIVNGTLETVGSEDEITSFEYLSPQSPTCNPETDIGETVVKYTPGGEEATEAYCYDAAGEITNWSGPEPEELPGEEDNSEELQEVPLGTCYENPEFPTAPGSCGEEDVPPEAEEGLEGSLNEVEVDPKDIAPKHYGIADENSLSAFPLFKNPYFEQLHVLDVRRQIPWNLVWEANHGNTEAQGEVKETEEWVKEVKALGGGRGQPTVTFESAICNANEKWVSPVTPGEEVTCTKKLETATGKKRRAPTLAEYKIGVREFLTHPTLDEVRRFVPYDEPNVREPGKPEGVLAGEYWRALDYFCNPKGPLSRSCEVAAGGFTDAVKNMKNAMKSAYFHNYVHGMAHSGTAYRWAWHAYQDGQETAGRKRGKPKEWWPRFKHFMEATDKATPRNHEIWLTEQGVVYNNYGKFAKPLMHGRHDGGVAARTIMKAYVERGPYQLTRQGTKYSHVHRFFYYDMRGEPDKEGEVEVFPEVKRKFFDTGLLYPPQTYPGSPSEVTYPRKIYTIYKRKTNG